MNIQSRIAPTPSGYLHLGNAFNFILTYLITKEKGGSLRLRIDDLDALRARQGYTEDIFNSLQWLGLRCDLGPRNVAEQAQCSQQLRTGIYQQVIAQLIASGLTYNCNCTHATISREGHCTCKGRHLSYALYETAVKISMPAHAVPRFYDALLHKEMNVETTKENHDFIILRKDGLPAYQVASLADDVGYGINLIVRGSDLLWSTAAQLYLAGILKWERFKSTTFYHHHLISNHNGIKLSKSAGSYSLKSMREEGRPVCEVYAAFCKWMGYSKSAGSLAEVLAFTNRAT